MKIEFDSANNEAGFNYRSNPKPFSEQPMVIQEAILVVAGKESKDIYQAKTRAEGCGCKRCHFDAQEVKDWYK